MQHSSLCRTRSYLGHHSTCVLSWGDRRAAAPQLLEWITKAWKFPFRPSANSFGSRGDPYATCDPGLRCWPDLFQAASRFRNHGSYALCPVAHRPSSGPAGEPDVCYHVAWTFGTLNVNSYKKTSYENVKSLKKTLKKQVCLFASEV